MDLKAALQRMANAAGKMREYFLDESRSGPTLDQLCLEYHMAFSVYEFQKAGLGADSSALSPSKEK